MRRPDELLHWVLLALCVSALGLSLILRVDEQQTVTLRLSGSPLPSICTFKRLLGVDCPGCGLTRSFISLAHGDVRSAWKFNPAGPLFFAIVLFQLPYRALQIWRLRRGLQELRLVALDAWCLWLLAAALMAQWIVLTAARALAQ
jgi:hypothetical protein